MTYRIKDMAKKPKPSQLIVCAADMRCLANLSADRTFVILARNSTGGLMSKYTLNREVERARPWFPRHYRGNIYSISIRVKSQARLFVHVHETNRAEIVIESKSGSLIIQEIVRSRMSVAKQLTAMLEAVVPKLGDMTPKQLDAFVADDVGCGYRISDLLAMSNAQDESREETHI